ncbi:hypothetical protein SEUCBS139899_001120 [Sporothrix eucalyptigena]
MIGFEVLRHDEADDGGDDGGAFDPRGDSQDAESSSSGKKRRMAPVQKDEGPACQSCRRKKAKCSRRQPCSFCKKHDIDCVYEDTRSRPGMRSGAIEQLNQRIGNLEKMFLGQGVLWQQVASCLESVASADHGNRQTASSSNGRGVPNDMLRASQDLHDHTAQLRTMLLGLGDRAAGEDNADDDDTRPPRKRQRPNRDDAPKQPVPETTTTATAPPSIDLPDDLQVSLVDIYFTRLHPWIPMLHEHHFRQTLASPDQRPRLVNILYAITSLCIRFSDDVRLGANRAARAQLAKTCRDTVILQSMQSFSVENLQALIICAFDTISSGRSPSAWSIIGSMTRTVEQLQLSVEDQDPPEAPSTAAHARPKAKANALIRRIAFLPPARDWVELEERRRVFWNVFLMDRFCSITTGWNLSLTSADVQRRLPCEGALWEEGRIEAPTPYFGVSEPPDPRAGDSSARSPADGDPTALGAFAYCIEATESLSLVTSFFLQQALDVADSQSVQRWLLRFKQLDLRLVRWKLFLPERWRDANSRNADNNLDPNLVVAHMTHNTAVVLLHQSIAYPSSEWLSVLPAAIRLPSPSSAETCLAAATEVAAIAAHVLRGTSLLTNPQIAFCLFVCGRMVLAHSTYYRLPLPAAFDSMTDSLCEISQRWRGTDSIDGTDGKEDTPGGHENLASKFASRLVHAKQMGASLDIRQAAYSEDTEPAAVTAPFVQAAGDMAYPTALQTHQSFSFSNSMGTSGTGLGESPDSMSLAFPPLPLAFQGATTNGNGTTSSNSTLGFDSIHASVYGNGTGMQDYAASLGGRFGGDKDMLEDLNSFLDYSFLPDQRVSIYTLPDV